MKTLIFSAFCLLSSGLLPVHLAYAENQQQPVYGSQIMTVKERADYLATLKDMKTEDDKEMYRIEHEELMQARARSKGIKLPGM